MNRIIISKEKKCCRSIWNLVLNEVKIKTPRSNLNRVSNFTISYKKNTLSDNKETRFAPNFYS